VLVEAQASGLPIVATRVGGIPEIVDGDGLISEPEDAEAFAAQMTAALAGLDGYDRAAIAARARSRYDLEPIGAAFAEVYRACLAGKL
jgi:glycosyltransferase involved in cell wall biosynthesis